MWYLVNQFAGVPWEYLEVQNTFEQTEQSQNLQHPLHL